MTARADLNDTLSRLRTSLADRYTIEREVGAGGMARVYEAEDVKHRRKVAVKVLRPELTEALGTERFLREIETIASLRHPHILPLFDSGEVRVAHPERREGSPDHRANDSLLFYVMPFVQGESLRARLDRERQLAVDDALHITREVASALGYAHGRGIVHRDIKPENILLESGHAVVTDFGIALAKKGSDDALNLTQPGLALGTPRYMSPEQASGTGEIDGRADVYSLACTLFEMLAGQPPFTATTFERMMYQLLSETPPPLTRLRSTVPMGVAAAVSRALAKSPADRYENTAAFIEALSKPVADRTEARSIAVLPFLNLSTDPENEYFADGITEDVIAQLSKIRALKVVSRSSVMPFKRREQNLRAIAAQLHVGALLDGSVRRAGTRVRIVAQLIDPETDQHLWGETFDRELTDIFEIQTEVALQIAAALQARLSSDERLRIRRQPTTDVRAYQLYLQGRHALVRFTSEGLHQAIGYFERAIARDPELALAHAGIGMAYTELGESGLMPPDEAYPRAKAAAARALELDPDLSEAHCTAAHVKLAYDFDWAGSEVEFKRALELNPNASDAYDLYGRLCSALERHDEAIVLQQRALELDPLVHKVDVATALLRARRYDEAAVAASRAVEVDRDDARAHCTLGWAYLGQGAIAEGLAEMERAVELAPGNNLWLAQLGQAYGLHGKPERAREILRELIEPSHGQYVSPYHLAYTYAGLGQYDDAMHYLEQAYEQRAGAIFGIKGSFLFAPLRSHPRFAALLRRMNLA